MREAEGGIRPETCRTELISSFPLPGLGLLRGRDLLVFCLTDYIGGDDGGGGDGDGGDGDDDGMMYCMAMVWRGVVAT